MCISFTVCRSVVVCGCGSVVARVGGSVILCGGVVACGEHHSVWERHSVWE